MATGLTVSLPFIIVPLLFPCEVKLSIYSQKADKNKPLTQRYWVKVTCCIVSLIEKANIWIAILSYIGNYFWTHYFYKVLGTRYTFPITWELNRVSGHSNSLLGSLLLVLDHSCLLYELSRGDQSRLTPLLAQRSKSFAICPILLRYLCRVPSGLHHSFYGSFHYLLSITCHSLLTYRFLITLIPMPR